MYAGIGCGRRRACRRCGADRRRIRSETIVWTFIDDQGTETTLAGNDTTIIAQETGYYKATVTDGGCERSDMVYIVVDENEVNGCNITGSIADDGSTLTLTYSGCTQPPSIQWTLDAGDGSGPQAYGTGPSVSSDNLGTIPRCLPVATVPKSSISPR